MTQYLYDGFLSEDTVNYIKDISRTHSFVCEIDKIPNRNKFDDVFSHMSYTVRGEDCMGQPYIDERKGINYIWLRKTDSEPNGFLFFPTKESFDLFLVNFESDITNRKPFQTIF